jgi:hypothetical protein
MENIREAVEAFRGALPAPLAAAGALLLGWLAAVAARFVASRLLALLRFDRVSERAGLSDFLRKGGSSRKPSALAGTIAYWAVLLVGLYEASKALDPRIAEALAERAIGLLPSAVAALLVAVLGAVLVSFLANFAMTIARNAGSPHAALISRCIKVGGYLVVATVALEEAGFGKTALSSIFMILFGALAFGLAIAFGLGGKDMARDALQKFARNLRERERGSKGPDLEG